MPSLRPQLAPTEPKTCLVTIGATASFDSLVAAALKPTFLKALARAGYSRLIVQYGLTGTAFFNSKLRDTEKVCGKLDGYGDLNLAVEGFEFKKGDFREFLKSVVGVEGIFVAHAGSGSLIDGMSVGVPTVLVPNTSLLDNHQEELAVKSEEAGYCIRGDINNLANAVEAVEMIRKNGYRKQGSETRTTTAGSTSLQRILDQEMGFLDRDLD